LVVGCWLMVDGYIQFKVNNLGAIPEALQRTNLLYFNLSVGILNPLVGINKNPTTNNNQPVTTLQIIQTIKSTFVLFPFHRLFYNQIGIRI